MKEMNEVSTIPSKNIDKKQNDDDNNDNVLVKCTNPLIVYLLIVGSIVLGLIVNYLMTSNALNNGKIIQISSGTLCRETNDHYLNCLQKENNNEDKCKYYMKSLEHCYDDTHFFNRICHIYLTELDYCLNHHNSSTTHCKSELKEVLDCTKFFPQLKLDKDLILSTILSS